jgi:hypothetical protein
MRSVVDWIKLFQERVPRNCFVKKSNKSSGFMKEGISWLDEQIPCTMKLVVVRMSYIFNQERKTVRQFPQNAKHCANWADSPDNETKTPH